MRRTLFLLALSIVTPTWASATDAFQFRAPQDNSVQATLDTNGNMVVVGSATALSFVGDGSQLTNITATNDANTITSSFTVLGGGGLKVTYGVSAASASFGSGATISTFSTTGALYMDSASSITIPNLANTGIVFSSNGILAANTLISYVPGTTSANAGSIMIGTTSAAFASIPASNGLTRNGDNISLVESGGNENRLTLLTGDDGNRLQMFSSGAGFNLLNFQKSTGTITSPAAIGANTQLGEIRFSGPNQLLSMRTMVDLNAQTSASGTGTNSTPAFFSIATTKPGNQAAIVNLIVTSSGTTCVNRTTEAACSETAKLDVNGAARFGSNGTVSTFTATGALTVGGTGNSSFYGSTMTITQGGSVGIGTANPLATLSVVGNSSFTSSGGTNDVVQYWNSSGNGILAVNYQGRFYIPSSDPITFMDSTKARNNFTISDDGTSITASNGTNSTRFYTQAVNGERAAGGGVGWVAGQSAWLQGGTTLADKTQVLYYDGTTNRSALEVATTASGFSTATLMLNGGLAKVGAGAAIVGAQFQVGTSTLVVMQNGNVGIGTSSPATPLDVNGAVAIRGDTTILGSSLTISGAITGLLIKNNTAVQAILQSGGTNVDAAIRSFDGTNSVYYGLQSGSGCGAGNWSIYAGGCRMVTTQAGNTGFGTTVPQAPLTVVGKSSFTSTTGSIADISDWYNNTGGGVFAITNQGYLYEPNGGQITFRNGAYTRSNWVFQDAGNSMTQTDGTNTLRLFTDNVSGERASGGGLYPNTNDSAWLNAGANPGNKAQVLYYDPTFGNFRSAFETASTASGLSTATIMLSGGLTRIGSGTPIVGAQFQVGGGSLVVTQSGNVSTTGQFLGANGSASAPGFAFTSATNTGLKWDNTNLSVIVSGGEVGRFSTAQDLFDATAFDFNGAGPFKIETAKVGIGTTTPTTALSVFGVITSSTTQGSVSCNVGTGVLSATCTDQHCTFAAGTLATSCTYTFGTAFPKTPDCVSGTDAATPIAISTTRTTTSVTIFAAAALTGDNITFICDGAP